MFLIYFILNVSKQAMFQLFLLIFMITISTVVTVISLCFVSHVMLCWLLEFEII